MKMYIEIEVEVVLDIQPDEPDTNTQASLNVESILLGKDELDLFPGLTHEQIEQVALRAEDMLNGD